MGKAKIIDAKRDRIIELRRIGFSIPEIHKHLGISKSTVFKYIQNIEIMPEFRQRWLDRRNASKIISEKAWSVANERAQDYVIDVSLEQLKLIGAALYWAEGAKRNFSFINSDAEMVRLFITILIIAYSVPKDLIQVSLRIFEDISIPEALNFWSKVTGLNLTSETHITVIKGSKKGKLPFGMCRVTVKKGGLLLKTMFAINKRVVSLTSLRSSMD